MVPESSNDINPSQMQTGIVEQLDGLESHLALLQRQVQQLQRLASLGTVSTMLAHEFNNLVTPIVGYCQYALQQGDGELMRTAVEKTLKNAQRLSTLCHRVLGMAVDDQMGPVDTPILPLVVEAVECLGRDLEKDNISLAVDVPEDLKARATASSLRHVLFNLIINARQAMLDGPGSLKVSGKAAGDGRVMITVADTGRGIKPEHLEKIFEPFFTTKQHEGRPDRRGIGMGLHICKQLMEEQDGEISVASKPGDGTTFTLTLPAVIN
ncbi:MAG: HAMP domain-containing histidine kinase [Phycisphaerae bacterium]|nr:HAMP domain-containing histidine kinase [Phycisphaerae bacterium]